MPTTAPGPPVEAPRATTRHGDPAPPKERASAPAGGPQVAPEAIHFRLGDIEAKRGDKAAARASCEEALRINPKFEQAKKALAGL